MSYEVLARKWRPQTFDDVVGQDHISKTLRRAAVADRISHAYMFSGPRGCGKTSTARILARVINCTDPQEGNPCNKCDSCIAVLKGNNLDVMEIDGASHTGVGEVRELQEGVGYAPSQYQNKVYIIDEVHMLSTHAFNALLKTLEEPPSHVYFIFATTAPNKIPDTIKSRCQRHHFKRLEISEIAGQLGAICKAEKVKFDDDGLRLLARKADGSMRDGTSLLDQCITASDGNVNTESVRDILGIIDQEKVLSFMRALSAGDPTAPIRLLNECINEGLDIFELCAALLEGYRDLMLLATPGDLADLLFRSKEEIADLKKLLDHYELGDVVTIVERLCNTIPRLRTAADPRVLLESLLVDLTLLDRQVDVRELLQRMESGGGSLPPGGGTRRKSSTSTKGSAQLGAQSDVAPRTSASERSHTNAAPRRPGAQSADGEDDVAGVGEEETLDTMKIAQLWDGFVNFVRQKKVSLGVSLISGKVHDFDGTNLTLKFLKNASLQREQVGHETNAEYLAGALRKYFGRDINLVCIAEGDSPRDIAPPQPDTTKAERIRGVSEEKRPVVKKLMDAFDGEIIRYTP